ncbi:Mu transposase C-terminal domain-containing protein [Ferrimonas balearica]|uniref:Mu transposase C-terminal domain-containing protein n=1 Tax=Ferrimonas balearica TaxID=44012 RepID=UPI001F3E5D6D|nr:Mu transposase C-terminal domain-containing protein [Ferrimonas balearica]MBY6094666.1 DDE-type integrase/transposase/recombinase [Ferrimonas balearica]
MASKGDSALFPSFEDEFVPELPVQEVDEANDEPGLIPRDIASYPESVRRETYRRADYLLWFRKHLTGGWTQKNLEPLLADAERAIGKPAPSWRTLASWWRSYKQAGFQLQALVPKHANKGNSKSRTTSAEQRFFDKAVQRYLIPQRPSVAAAYEFYESSIRVENAKLLGDKVVPISYRAFLDRINRLPPYEVMKARHGKHKADVEFDAVGSHFPPDRVLEWVEIDHTPLDIILLDDELHIPLGRAFLTLLVDSYSKCVVGFHIGYKEPSYYSVKMALHNAMRPKEETCKRFSQLKNDWPCHGKIETLVVDNGAEFWSKSLEQACLEVVTDIQFNPVKRPWLKPLVERMYRTINQKLLIDIPGKTFSNILEKEDYDPAKDAIVRFSTFVEVFHLWVIDVYHMDADSRFNGIPYWSWQKSVERLPPLPLSDEDQKKLEIVLAQSDYRQHRRGGIHIHNLRYDCDEFAAYRKYHTVNRGRGEQPSLLVKTNPDDLSYIHVYVEQLQGYLSVPCVDPLGYTKGLTLQQHKVNCRLHREFIKEQLDLDSLAQVRMALHRRIEQEAAEINAGKRSSKVKQAAKLARQQNVSSSGMGTVVPEPIEGSLVNNRAEEASPSLLTQDEWDEMISELKPYESSQ